MTEQRWTPLIGLRQAALHVAIRALPATLGWALVLWVAAPVLEWLPFTGRVLPLIILVMIWPGMTIGYGLSRGVADAAGMVGWPVTAIVVGGVALSVWGGAELATAFRPIGDWQLGMANLSAGAGGVIWAFRDTMFES